METRELKETEFLLQNIKHQLLHTKSIDHDKNVTSGGCEGLQFSEVEKKVYDQIKPVMEKIQRQKIEISHLQERSRLFEIEKEQEAIKTAIQKGHIGSHSSPLDKWMTEMKTQNSNVVQEDCRSCYNISSKDNSCKEVIKKELNFTTKFKGICLQIKVTETKIDTQTIHQVVPEGDCNGFQYTVWSNIYLEHLESELVEAIRQDKGFFNFIHLILWKYIEQDILNV